MSDFWVRDNYKWVFGIIFNKLGSVQDSIDLTQDTFLAAYLHLDCLKDPSKLRPWLKTIAINKVKSFLRWKLARATHMSLDDSKSGFDLPDLKSATDSACIQNELQVQLLGSIIHLPDKFKEVILLSLICGLSQRDCAEILDVPVSTVNNRIFKAKRMLRKELDGIMEGNEILFQKQIEGGINSAEQIILYIKNIITAFSNHNFDHAEDLLMKAPILAGDISEWHLVIASLCDAVNNIMAGMKLQKKESLYNLAEREFKLAEKLDFRGTIDPHTQDEAPRYRPYDMMAQIYARWGKEEKALEYARKSIELGNPFCLVEGEVYMHKNEYEKAIDFFKSMICRSTPDTDITIPLNRIAQCYKKIGLDNDQLEYMMKEYHYRLDHSNDNEIGKLIADNEYYIALWYARHGDTSNMLKYLRLCIDRDNKYAAWARCRGNAFDRYRSLPGFTGLVGEGEANDNVIC